MKFKALLSAFFMLFLSACEMGHDKEGPYKAYLALKDDNGKIVNFYLGGYDKLSHCVGLLKYETDGRKYFWTNTDYTYGGERNDDWIKNEIVGASCDHEDSFKGWKVLSVKPSNDVGDTE